MNIIIFGGTFDPPHSGHVLFAKKAKEFLGEGRVFVVPSFVSPNKAAGSITASPKQRAEMCRIAFEGVGEVDEIEQRREVTSYTVDTIRYFKEKFPTDKLFFLLGDDKLEAFFRWRGFEEILANVTVVVACRGDGGNVLLDIERLRSHGGEVVLLDFDAKDISSSLVRKGRFDGVTPKLFEYIKEHGIYMHEETSSLFELIPKRRLLHTQGVEKAAMELRDRHFPELSEDEVRKAAILHDITKYYSLEEHLELCEKNGVVLRDNEKNSKRVLHQITGAIRAKQLGMSDAVCDAIRYHTTGRKNMSPLEKVLLFADYIEENRDYDSLDEIRECYRKALDTDELTALDVAIVFALGSTIKEVVDRGEMLHPDTVDARNYIIENKSI